MAQRRKPSPVLGAATILVQDAGETFITGTSRFKHTFEAPVELIRPDPGQARKSFDEDGLRTLASTMEAEGQLQPVLLRRDTTNGRGWIIVAGERRWRAAKINGWTKLLAIEYDGDPEVASLLENLQRVDLTPREEASALQRLIEGKGWTQLQAAEALGKRASDISGVLRILSLPNEVLEVLTSEHPVARNVLIELARLPDNSVRQQLVEEARIGKLTVKAIRLSRASVAAAPPQTASGGRSFNFATLERVAARLNDLRVTKPTVNDVDRARLIRLRQEIDALLQER